MTVRIAEPGVYKIAAADYHADPCRPASLSSTGARQILAECPARFWYDRQNPPAPSEALTVGSAAHEWLLEGDTWPQRHTVLPEDFNGRTNAGKELVAAIEADGKRAVKFEDFEAIKAMVAALKAHEYAYAAFQNGRPEMSMFWRDPELGIWCRARPDWLPLAGGIVADYKTTRSAEPEYLSRAMFDLGYHQQAEWYLSGVRALDLYETPRFLLVFQEKTPPYCVTCVTPSDAALTWAAIQNRKSREVFARCLETGVWPAYADDILTLDLPIWAEKKLEAAHERGEFAPEGVAA